MHTRNIRITLIQAIAMLICDIYIHTKEPNSRNAYTHIHEYALVHELLVT
jgi:hypothetical protein